MSQSTTSQSAQLNSQNQLQQQQQAAQNQLLQQNNNALSPYLTGNQGFTPQQMSALNSQALDQNALRFNQATQGTNQQLAARGEGLGNTPGSGVAATGYGNLQAAKAGDLSDSLRTVTLNDAQQGLANKFNAASVLSGNAQTYGQNVGTYGQGANGALNALTQAQSNTWQSQLGKAAGQALGGAAGAFGAGAGASALGGLGTAVNKIGSGNWGWLWIFALMLVVGNG
jgi:hypothetical protein